MSITTPKSESVTKDGQNDGWTPPAGFLVDKSGGVTRLVVSVPTEFLASFHREMIKVLTPPLSFLYRQRVDRKKPRPNGSPPRDFLALDLEPQVVLAALNEVQDLVYHDGRCEVWIRGRRGEQVVLDHDGLLFVYPDDPLFRAICHGYGLSQGDMVTIADRDYVKHWYHAENDALEAGLIEGLGLQETS